MPSARIPANEVSPPPWRTPFSPSPRFLRAFSSAARLPVDARLVERVQKRYDAATDFRARFTNADQHGDGPEDQLAGGVMFKKPGRMRWDYDKPEKATYVSDGGVLGLRTGYGVGLQTGAERRHNSSLRGFSHRQGEAGREFDITAVAKSVYGMPGDYLLSLSPKVPEPQVKNILFVVDPKTFDVRGSVITDGQGNLNDLTFADIKTNSHLPESIPLLAAARCERHRHRQARQVAPPGAPSGVIGILGYGQVPHRVDGTWVLPSDDLRGSIGEPLGVPHLNRLDPHREGAASHGGAGHRHQHERLWRARGRGRRLLPPPRMSGSAQMPAPNRPTAVNTQPTSASIGVSLPALLDFIQLRLVALRRVLVVVLRLDIEDPERGPDRDPHHRAGQKAVHQVLAAGCHLAAAEHAAAVATAAAVGLGGLGAAQVDGRLFVLRDGDRLADLFAVWVLRLDDVVTLGDAVDGERSGADRRPLRKTFTLSVAGAFTMTRPSPSPLGEAKCT